MSAIDFDDKYWLTSGHGVFIAQPERSEWSCELFGAGRDLVLRPIKGKEPNWFWRWMQYLCFGNKWSKDKII